MQRLMLVTIVILVALALEGNCWRRRRRRRSPPPCPVRSCQVSQWSSWGHCSQDCGNNGIQTRTRTKTVAESCGGSCHHALTENRPCNRHCKNGGVPQAGHCSCNNGFTGKCCEQPPPCPVKSCQVGLWSSWGSCSQICGNNGIQTRTRTKTVTESCGGSCNYDFIQNRPCNRYCLNGGILQPGHCRCNKKFTGKCCELRFQRLFTPPTKSPAPNSMKSGEIAAIVCGVIGLLGIISGVVYKVYRRNKAPQTQVKTVFVLPYREQGINQVVVPPSTDLVVFRTNAFNPVNQEPILLPFQVPQEQGMVYTASCNKPISTLQENKSQYCGFARSRESGFVAWQK